MPFLKNSYPSATVSIYFESCSPFHALSVTYPTVPFLSPSCYLQRCPFVCVTAIMRQAPSVIHRGRQSAWTI